jgi:membrane glycosyltransferase
VTAMAGLLADFMFRRREWYRALFNFGMCSVTVYAASAVFHKTGGTSTGIDALLSPLNALPLLLSGATYFFANTILVAGVAALHRNLSVYRVWRESFAFSYEFVGAVVLKLLGYLFAILFLTWGYMSAFLAVIVTYFIRDAYIRYVTDMELAEKTRSAAQQVPATPSAAPVRAQNESRS